MHQKTSLHDLLPEIKEAFSKSPFLTRKATKALNLLLSYTATHTLKPEHAKNLFFYILRGLNSEDIFLKSLLYSALMQLKTSESFLAISSLTKDLNSDYSHIVKSKALLTLFVICPQQMINDFDKYVSQSLISKFENRRDAGILCCLLYCTIEKESVKKWVMNLDLARDSTIKGYHALSLLSHTKKNLLNTIDCKKYNNACNLVILNLMLLHKHSYTRFRETIKMYLQSRDEMTLIEVCRIISKLDEKDVYMSSVISILSGMLRSTKKHIKFAAVRTVLQYIRNSEEVCIDNDENNNVVFDATSYYNNNYYVKNKKIKTHNRYINTLSVLNKEIEELLSSTNKTLSMMAITILLNTVTEETIERVLKNLPDMINDMTDTFKTVVISALLNMSKKKEKEEIFLKFVQKCIYNKGSIEFKRYLINVLKNLSDEIQYNDKKRDGSDKTFNVHMSLIDDILDIFSSFIEDSPSPILTMDVLNLMGMYVGKSKNYKKYIVHVLNRLILENSYVRCAALQCLYFISLDVKEIKERITKVFDKCKCDEDELVAEEAEFLLKRMYDNKNEEISSLHKTTYKMNGQTGSNSFNKLINCNINDSHTETYNNPDFIAKNDFNGLRTKINSFLNESEKEILHERIVLCENNGKNSIKNTKEVKLSKSDDFGIFMRKEIMQDKVKVIFRIENLLENVNFKGGKLNIAVKNNEKSEKYSIEVDKIEGERIIEKEMIINSTSDDGYKVDFVSCIVINSNFVYDICMDEDFDDKETEKIVLNPFMIDVFDFVEYSEDIACSYEYKKKVNVKLNDKDLLAAKNKITEMFNMKIVNESIMSDGFVLEMIGMYKNKNIKIRVNCNTKFVCEVEIKSDCEKLLECGIAKFM
ncbi:Coatomer subunit gamma-1 [Binucleata daphniae]